MSGNEFIFLLMILGIILEISTSTGRESVTFCPSEIPNGRLDSNCTARTSAVCDFRCKKGFRRLEGVVMIVCLPDGSWTVNEVFLCQPEKDVKNHSRRDFDAASVFCGVAAGILIACVIYILKIMVKQRLRKMKKEENLVVRFRRSETERSVNDYTENSTMLPNSDSPNPSTVDGKNPKEGKNDNSKENRKDNSLKRDKPNRAPKTKEEEHVYKNVFKKGPYENV